MRDFQKVVVLLILLLLQVADLHSMRDSFPEPTTNKSQSQNQDGEEGLEAVTFEASQELELGSDNVGYEIKYSAGDIDIPFGLLQFDYKSFELPPGPRDRHGSVPVSISMAILSLPDFQEDKEELSIDWYFSVGWQDNRFNEDLVKNQPFLDPTGALYLDPRLIDRIWHPHITLNSLKSMSQVALMGAPGFLKITPRTSSVRYQLRNTFQSSCKTDYTYYPFDIVVCPISIHSYLYFATKQVRLSKLALERQDELDVPGFQVVLSSWPWGAFLFQDRNFSTYGLQILLKRDVTSHVIQFYIPSAVFIIICFGSFTLAEASDRITCTSLSLLSLFVLLGSIGSTPQGPYVTYLHKWVLMCILIVFLPLVEIFLSLKLRTYAERREKRIQKERKEAEADAKRKEGENGDLDVEASCESTNTNTNTTPTPKEGQGEEPRKSKLLKMVWLIEKSTPYLVISTFIIYNIYYWSVLITGSHDEFKEYINEAST